MLKLFLYSGKKVSRKTILALDRCHFRHFSTFTCSDVEYTFQVGNGWTGLFLPYNRVCIKKLQGKHIAKPKTAMNISK